jgi:uncharacterized protein (DUF2267 family)
MIFFSMKPLRWINSRRLCRLQIGTGGPAVSPRSPGVMRSVARAEATYGRLINQLRLDADLDDAEKARTALEIVLKNVVRRLTLGEAKDLVAQLPSKLQPILQGLPPGPDKLITRETVWNNSFTNSASMRAMLHRSCWPSDPWWRGLLAPVRLKTCKVSFQKIYGRSFPQSIYRRHEGNSGMHVFIIS